MKYSKGFERDYNFYISNLKNFDFCGTKEPKYAPIPDLNGLTAKEVFYKIQSEGVNKPCKEPELLSALLLCQAGINFQIKQWAEGRSDGTLPLAELSKKEAKKLYPHLDFSFIDQDIQTEYNLPDWVVKAVQSQYYANN
ncbi:hypothetical protein [Mucilaginibacter sp.]|jgi:hypothetical protein|uniref:hypothetical protein n=1 Tax=Mucilaginibacter sp. TaxID=1882438 RepID=UPI003562CFE5